MKILFTTPSPHLVRMSINLAQQRPGSTVVLLFTGRESGCKISCISVISQKWTMHNILFSQRSEVVIFWNTKCITTCQTEKENCMSSQWLYWAKHHHTLEFEQHDPVVLVKSLCVVFVWNVFASDNHTLVQFFYTTVQPERFSFTQQFYSIKGNSFCKITRTLHALRHKNKCKRM